MIDIRREVLGSPGFSTQLSLKAYELDTLSAAVKSAMRRRVLEAYTHAGLENYHTVTHEKLWGSKRDRLLTEENVEAISSFEFLQDIRSEFGEYRIAPELVDGVVSRRNRHIYFRVQRPHADTDVAEIHADDWYHRHFEDDEGLIFPEGQHSLKIWIPLACQPRLNGIAVAPDSHQRTWKRSESYSQERKRWVIKLEEEAPKLYLLPTKPGTVLLFNQDLLHQGVLNQGGATRVSVEITLLFDEELRA